MTKRPPSSNDVVREIRGHRTSVLKALRDHYKTSDRPLQHMDVRERDTHLRWIEAELDRRNHLGHYQDTDKPESQD